jgi:UDP-glucose 4-epimerase
VVVASRALTGTDPGELRSMAMRILVTGAAGFIGSHVCERLLAGGHDVVGIDDLSTGDASNLDGIGVRLITASILDPDALTAAGAGADGIVHLAAIPSVPRSIDNPAASHDANATGTLRVLEAARQLDDPIVVLASSSSVYGANPTLPKHEGLATQPMSPYAVSKLAAEQYAMAYQHCYGLRTLAFRFFNVFGPRQAPGHAYAAVVPAFVHAALLGEPLPVHGDGTQSRDFTYVGTVSEVIVDAVTRGVTNPTPVNLAFGSRVSLLDVIERLRGLIDTPIAAEHTASRPGDVPHSQADNTLLRSLFPDVEPVALDDGLAATVAWMRSWLSAST